MASKIEDGMWIDYANGEYTASAYATRNYETGEMMYSISFHKGAMPAFNSKEYKSLNELEAAMREIANLRKWRTTR